ncbi:magnesium transporter [Desulfitibacter alkalitolerans]|uniref:magnesium transporter n=1 Tax=Desulfitibacter alkalitolerans TaxID=264641 RepID=UPI00048395C1|nr:magnesium transporter [Desulfitibacter alkalitolerans]
MALFNGTFDAIVLNLSKGNKEKLREIFDEIHPYDQAQILMELSAEHRRLLADFLTDEEMAEIIQELSIEQQKLIIDELGIERYSKIIVEMPSDDAADLLGDLDEDRLNQVLDLMGDKEEADLRELMEYPENTAGGLMTTEYIVLPEDFTADEAIKKLRQLAPDAETVYYLYVIDSEGRLRGVLSLRDLIIASPETKIHDIMYERVVSVPIDMDQEEVAKLIDKYDFLAVPVVDKQQKLVGIITVDDAMDVLAEEASEDIAKLGGIGGGDPGVLDINVKAIDAAKRRIPWLALLLCIGIFSGNIIAQFEDTLDKVVVLAFFIPVIAGMAGNTGTQSLAVVVRGLATGQFAGSNTLKLIKREAGVGLIIGTTNGILISLIAALWQRNIILGFIIGLALWITLIVATLAGTIIPLIMARLKIDPAVASGPFITTINDILGLTIYFTVATAFMKYLL